MIKDVILKEGIDLNLQVESKSDLFYKMATVLYENNKIDNIDSFVTTLNNREKEGCTGMGSGIAIPHGKSTVVKEPTVLFSRLSKGIEYESLDDEPVNMIFMIAVPENSNNTHLKMISELARKLMHKEFIQSLLSATSRDDIINLL